MAAFEWTGSLWLVTALSSDRLTRAQKATGEASVDGVITDAEFTEPGSHGARIEHIVACTDAGVDRLNIRPREPRILEV